jgi:hypothetical protein
LASTACYGDSFTFLTLEVLSLKQYRMDSHHCSELTELREWCHEQIPPARKNTVCYFSSNDSTVIQTRFLVEKLLEKLINTRDVRRSEDNIKMYLNGDKLWGWKTIKLVQEYVQ